MGIRLAEEKDFHSIMEIIDVAKQILKNDGIDQWQNGYPNMDAIIQDYKNGHLYVYVDNDENGKEKVLGTCSIGCVPEHLYENALTGKWSVDGKYATVHRLAVSPEAKGKSCAQKMMEFAYKIAKERKCKSVRVDTHDHNIRMIRVLEKSGYNFVGILTYDSNAKIYRNAYDIVIK